MGLFVTIEGIEASGKSTLVRALGERLHTAGVDPVVTREPGGTEFGQQIRALLLQRVPELAIEPLAEAYLVNAARAQHVAELLRPMLAGGRIVLCDRFTDSTLAYQGYGRGLDLTVVRQLCEMATGSLSPDLTIVVDVPIEVSRARMRERHGVDRIEFEPPEFHARVRDGFLALAAQTPRMRTVDGTQPPQAVLARAWDLIEPLLADRR
ncbi:MAG: dTMP kinase [Vulcanimicrobiaceae bacterium]